MFSDNDNLKKNVAVSYSNNEFDYDWAMKRLKKMMANSFFGDIEPESVSFFSVFQQKGCRQHSGNRKKTH